MKYASCSTWNNLEYLNSIVVLSNIKQYYDRKAVDADNMLTRFFLQHIFTSGIVFYEFEYFFCPKKEFLYTKRKSNIFWVFKKRILKDDFSQSKAFINLMHNCLYSIYPFFSCLITHCHKFCSIM